MTLTQIKYNKRKTMTLKYDSDSITFHTMYSVHSIVYS